MASTRDFADYILDKFSSLDVVRAKPMMGEYVLHMAGKVLGFISDDQLLLEPGPTIDRLLPDVEKKELFPGSKLFHVIPDGMSSGELCNLAEAIYDDLPVSKPRKSKKQKETASNQSFPFEKFMDTRR